MLSVAAYRLLDGGWPPYDAGGGSSNGFSTTDMLLLAGLSLAAVPLTLLLLAAGTQRCRDCGITGWAALLLLVPPLNLPMLIALGLCPGQDGANRYGESPLRRTEVASRFGALLDMNPAEK